MEQIHVASKEKNIVETFERGLLFCTYAKFFEKLTFLTSLYAQVCVRIRGKGTLNLYVTLLGWGSWFYYESLEENGCKLYCYITVNLKNRMFLFTNLNNIFLRERFRVNQ